MVTDGALRRRFRGRALLVASGLFLGLGIMEIAVRVLDVPPRPLPPLHIADYQISTDPAIAYEYRANYRAADDHLLEGLRGLATNGAGFRDHDYPEAKPPGTYRVIILGDSTTAGNHVSDLDKVYAKRLEALLNATHAGGMQFEVLNMGVGGYQTMQEAETLRVKGLRYDPDLVLLTVCVNDFDLHADGGVYQQLRATRRAAAGTPDPDGLLAHSRLAFVLYHRLHTSLSVENRLYERDILKGRTTVRAGLGLLSELQRAHGFAMLVLILPAFTDPFSAYTHTPIHQRVFEEADGLAGITVVDLLDRFARIDDDAQRFAVDGLHLNEYGHEVMAELLLPMVSALAADSHRSPQRHATEHARAGDGGAPPR